MVEGVDSTHKWWLAKLYLYSLSANLYWYLLEITLHYTILTRNEMNITQSTAARVVTA
jgi:hypothetical protein